MKILSIKGFLAIPAKYRCNPFKISPSGDLFWADQRNVEQLKSRLSEPPGTNCLTVSTPGELKSLLDSL